MNEAEYYEVLEEEIKLIWEKIRSKTHQYKSGSNALDNIDSTASEGGKIPEDVLVDQQGKHRSMLRKYREHLRAGGNWKTFDDTVEISAPTEGHPRAAGDGIRELIHDTVIYELMGLPYLHLRIKGRL